MLRDLGRVEAAVASQHQAVHLEPKKADALQNLGVALRDLGRRDQALDCFERALDGTPGHVPSKLDRGRTLRLAGEYAAGFKDLGARFQSARYALRGLETPSWDGGAIKGKAVLVQCEGTPGDVIMFSRYFPMIKEKGGNVLVEAPEGLADLLSTVQGVDKVVLQDADLPAFDLHAPLLSLPGIFGTTPKTIPAGGPYVQAHDPGAHALPPAGGLLKVGVAWSDERATQVHGPAPGLTPFLELAGLAGYTLYGLQTGPAARELADDGAAAPILDVARRTDALSDMAGLIEQLDLVIAVDGAVARMTSALGKETWVIAPCQPDWRWGTSGDKSPWYPNTRVLRVERRGDWQTLFDQARPDLRARIRR